MPTYTVILTRPGTHAMRLVGEPLKAETLKDAHLIAGRFCPVHGQALIYEHSQPGSALSEQVAVINQRVRM